MFPLGIIACLVVILVPLPPALMDLLLACNITIGVIVLLTTIHVATPLEFSVFPSLLLATTLARLVLNVATTRLILTAADDQGLAAAGGVIRSFGQFVAGDQVAVGLIIFLIIVLIQFVVITKGSSRISEVAARFALDGMPGRQMAIDADVNAGLIDEQEAQRRRDEIRAQADFYGAMDGASKFVRGDAIAGIVITIINILGGLYIGVIQAGMPVGQAVDVYTKLTIGDGLVSQVPALLISVAAGLLVTRSAQQANLPTQFLQQLFGNSRALAIAGGFLILLIATNLPTIPIATLGIGCVGLAIVMNRQDTILRREEEEKSRRAAQSREASASQRRVEDYLSVDPMELSIGLGLLDLADPARGGDLMQRIGAARNSIATDIGIVLPKVRVHDDVQLGEFEYQIQISGNPVGQADVQPGKLLAVDGGRTTGTVAGQPAGDTPYGRPAWWIDVSQREQAAIYGYSLFTAGEVLVSHLESVAKLHADDLLSRDATKDLIDRLRETSPSAVDELIPGVMTLGQVQQVLKLLLREDVPIRQLGTILEALSDAAAGTDDLVQLCEAVRQRLCRTICTRYRDQESILHVLTLDPGLEDQISESMQTTEQGLFVRFSPELVDITCGRIQEAAKKLLADGHPPVVLVGFGIRTAVKQITSSPLPWLKVLSYHEITRDTKVQSHGVIGL